MVKPAVEIYHHVLQENKLQGSETLFLDDNTSNIEGARLASINAIEVTTTNSIIELLKDAIES